MYSNSFSLGQAFFFALLPNVRSHYSQGTSGQQYCARCTPPCPTLLAIPSGTLMRRWPGPHTYYFRCPLHAVPVFTACVDGCRCMRFDPGRRTRRGICCGICRIQDPAHRSVPTGATIFLYYWRTRPAETHHNPSTWGLWHGGWGSQHFH